MEIIDQKVSLPINVTFSLLEDKCLSFKLTEYGEKNKIKVAFDSYEFVFNINLNIIESEKQVKINLSCKLFEKQIQNTKLELAELNAFTIFHIYNFNEIVLKDANNNFLLPNPVIELCNGITFSSVRGMFSVKLDDTLYANAVLPLIDPKSLLPKQLVTE